MGLQFGVITVDHGSEARKVLAEVITEPHSTSFGLPSPTSPGMSIQTGYSHNTTSRLSVEIKIIVHYDQTLTPL